MSIEFPFEEGCCEKASCRQHVAKLEEMIASLRLQVQSLSQAHNTTATSGSGIANRRSSRRLSQGRGDVSEKGLNAATTSNSESEGVLERPSVVILPVPNTPQSDDLQQQVSGEHLSFSVGNPLQIHSPFNSQPAGAQPSNSVVELEEPRLPHGLCHFEAFAPGQPVRVESGPSEVSTSGSHRRPTATPSMTTPTEGGQSPHSFRSRPIRVNVVRSPMTVEVDPPPAPRTPVEEQPPRPGSRSQQVGAKPRSLFLDVLNDARRRSPSPMSFGRPSPRPSIIQLPMTAPTPTEDEEEFDEEEHTPVRVDDHRRASVFVLEVAELSEEAACCAAEGGAPISETYCAVGIPVEPCSLEKEAATPQQADADGTDCVVAVRTLVDRGTQTLLSRSATVGVQVSAAAQTTKAAAPVAVKGEELVVVETPARGTAQLHPRPPPVSPPHTAAMWSSSPRGDQWIAFANHHGVNALSDVEFLMHVSGVAPQRSTAALVETSRVMAQTFPLPNQEWIPNSTAATGRASLLSHDSLSSTEPTGTYRWRRQGKISSVQSSSS